MIQRPVIRTVLFFDFVAFPIVPIYMAEQLAHSKTKGFAILPLEVHPKLFGVISNQRLQPLVRAIPQLVKDCRIAILEIEQS